MFEVPVHTYSNLEYDVKGNLIKSTAYIVEEGKDDALQYIVTFEYDTKINP